MRNTPLKFLQHKNSFAISHKYELLSLYDQKDIPILYKKLFHNIHSFKFKKHLDGIIANKSKNKILQEKPTREKNYCIRSVS